MEIKPGMSLQATTAHGNVVSMVALTTEVPGRDLPVVWVCEASDYEVDGSEAYAIPWPTEALELSS